MFGYIDFVAEPSFEPIPNTDKIDLTLNFDEGKQFFVRRIDFSGNTTTRDKVIRRAAADRRRRRLQQAPVGAEHSAPEPARLFRGVEGGRGGRYQARHQEQHGGHHAQGEGARQELHSVERRRFGAGGKLRRVLLYHQQFPGSGRNAELSTARSGTMQRNATLGFTEPYLFDLPLQVGVTVFISRFNYNQARAGVDSGRAEPDPAVQPTGHSRTC